MRYLENESTYIISNFTTGDTVTIDVYRLSDNVKVINAASMTEIGTTGRFKYAFAQTISTKTEYLYVCTNTTEEQQGKIILGGYPDTILTDTNDLQTNQSNWLTATGFSVPHEYDTPMGYIPSNLGDVPTATELISTHGTGAWITADISTLATSANVAAVPSDVWDEDISTHTTPKTFGKILQQIKSIVNTIIGLIS